MSFRCSEPHQRIIYMTRRVQLAPDIFSSYLVFWIPAAILFPPSCLYGNAKDPTRCLIATSAGSCCPINSHDAGMPRKCMCGACLKVQIGMIDRGSEDRQSLRIQVRHPSRRSSGMMSYDDGSRSDAEN